MRCAALVSLLFVACAADEPATDPLSNLEQEATVCGAGPTVKGIDISKWQGTINWAQVAGDGVEYAFIRVSDGVSYLDEKFAANWAGARAHGVLRGAYQFFRPSEDPIAQADLLIARMGTLEADDLPPVIDVEDTDGLAASVVAAKVRIWIDHVQQVTGRTPIVYTGFYFWRDQVGAADVTTSPLWHAQYSSAQCPTIAPPWTDWAFWQYTSSGAVAGIAGNVDMNRFNGTRAELVATMTGPAQVCGTIAATGGTIDDGDACFTSGGPLQYIRSIVDAGEGGDLEWTHATEDATEANYGQWNLDFEAAGRYRVEVYTASAYAQSRQALYVIEANGEHHEVAIDQTAVDGWQSLGDLEFAAGGGQFVHLADNTGELLADQIQLVFDSVRVTPSTPERMGSGSGPTDPTAPTDPPSAGGCNAGSSSLGFGALALVLGLRRRSRRL